MKYHRAPDHATNASDIVLVQCLFSPLVVRYLARNALLMVSGQNPLAEVLLSPDAPSPRCTATAVISSDASSRELLVANLSVASRDLLVLDLWKTTASHPETDHIKLSLASAMANLAAYEKLAVLCDWVGEIPSAAEKRILRTWVEVNQRICASTGAWLPTANAVHTHSRPGGLRAGAGSAESDMDLVSNPLGLSPLEAAILKRLSRVQHPLGWLLIFPLVLIEPHHLDALDGGGLDG